MDRAVYAMPYRDISTAWSGKAFEVLGPSIHRELELKEGDARA